MDDISPPTKSDHSLYTPKTYDKLTVTVTNVNTIIATNNSITGNLLSIRKPQGR